MNKPLLKIAHNNLMEWASKGASDTKKLEVIMVSLADICTALATDGTQKSIDEWSKK